MSEPLDFTAAGRKAMPPPPERPAPARVDMPNIAPVMAVVTILALVLAIVVGAFFLLGRGGKKVSAGSATTVARYCQLAKEFDGVAAAEAVAAMGATLDEMKADAPPAIRADVAAVVAALPAPTPAAAAHRQRIAAFETKTCNGGGGTNDQ